MQDKYSKNEGEALPTYQRECKLKKERKGIGREREDGMKGFPMSFSWNHQISLGLLSKRGPKWSQYYGSRPERWFKVGLIELHMDEVV